MILMSDDHDLDEKVSHAYDDPETVDLCTMIGLEC